MKKTVKLVGEVAWYDISAEYIENELQGLTSNDEVEFIINSGGGSVFEGSYIYNLLQKCSAKKVGHIYGISASMMTIIGLAMDEIYMCPLSMYMTHNVSVGLVGNTKSLEEAKSLVDKLDSILLESYKKRGISKSVIKNELMNGKDNWFTPKEALNLGLIDGIKEPVKEIIDNDAILAKYNYNNLMDVAAASAENRSKALNKLVTINFQKMETKTKDLENPKAATSDNTDLVASLNTELSNHKSKLQDKETEIVNLTERLEKLEKEKETIVANAQSEVAKAKESETAALEKVNAMEVKLYKQEVENRVNLAIAKITENGKFLNSDKAEKIKVAFLQKHSIIIENDKESCVDKYTNGVIGDSINAAINCYVIDAGFVSKQQRGINANVNNANGASYSFENSNNLDEAKAILAKQRELNKQGYATYSAAYTNAMLSEFGNSENEHIAALKAYKR